MSLNNYHCVQNNKMTQSEKDLNLFIVDRRHQNYTRPSMNKSGAVNLYKAKKCGILNICLWKSSVISWQNTNTNYFFWPCVHSAGN